MTKVVYDTQTALIGSRDLESIGVVDDNETLISLKTVACRAF